MKITLLLCMMAVLTSCSKDVSSSQPQPTASKKGGGGMDSPIVVSDSSTHLRHPVFHEKTGDKFSVYDNGYQAVTLTFCSITGCPGKQSIPLVKGWTLDVFDSAATLIITLNSDDNLTIFANFHTHPVDIGGSSTNTDISQASLTFQNATLTNGDKTQSKLKCTDDPSTSASCSLQIEYCTNNTCT